MKRNAAAPMGLVAMSIDMDSVVLDWLHTFFQEGALSVDMFEMFAQVVKCLGVLAGPRDV